MKKVRVHQLAKELGLTNAECLEICQQLGVEVKSHSSSMEEPQADRVRRKAEREGLIKKPKATEEKKSSKKTATKKSAAPKKAESKKAATVKTTAKKTTAAKKSVTQPASKKSTTKKASTTTTTPVEEKAKAVKSKSAPTSVEERPAKAEKAEKKDIEKQDDQKQDTSKTATLKKPMLSRSGKPIPPPPKPTTPKSVAPRRQPSKVRPDVVLPSSKRISSLLQKSEAEKDVKPEGRQQPHFRPRRRTGRRRRRSPLQELQPVGEPEYTPANTPVPSGIILIERGSTPADLAPKMNRTVADIIKYFFEHGETITANTSLTDEFVELYCLELGAEISLINPGEEAETELMDMLEIPESPDDELVSRIPIVTVMGHVDHGKTQLLDTIRNANVISGEKGGITQHIGAYKVEHKGSEITFIDTPGHEAFTAMRARGANVTDVVILVVAADDGVMPQTIEAINHAKAAGAPIVVAVNKIDLETKNVNRILQQLAEHELVVESYGGDIQVVEVSAKEGTGIDELLENVSLAAELEELKTVDTGRASGVVLESQMNPGQGAVATLLVYQGTLSVGDPIVAGSASGKVRALVGDKGEKLKQAGPGTPVQVLGLSQMPRAGADFVCAPSESIASKVAEKRQDLERGVSLTRSNVRGNVASSASNLEDVFSNLQVGQVVTLNLIVKADTFGSLEAISDRLQGLKTDNLKITYVHRGVGGINENDIKLAVASSAIIIGFNIRPDKKIRDLATDESVEIRTYEIIYKLVEDVEDALKGMLVPEFEEVVTGEAEVKEVFHIKDVGFVAGCMVNSGKLSLGSGVRFLRDGAIIWKGEIKSLKRFTDDVKEVQVGNECGIGLSDFQDLKAEDIIETYESREVEAKV